MGDAKGVDLKIADIVFKGNSEQAMKVLSRVLRERERKRERERERERGR